MHHQIPVQVSPAQIQKFVNWTIIASLCAAVQSRALLSSLLFALPMGKLTLMNVRCTGSRVVQENN